MAKPGYSSWYNTFLTPNEQRGQVSHRATVARRKAKEMKVNVGETKRVKVDENAPTVSRSSKAGLIRENAQMQNGGKTVVRAIQNSDTRQRIAQALSRPTATKRGVAYNQNAQMNASDKKKKR